MSNEEVKPADSHEVDAWLDDAKLDFVRPAKGSYVKDPLIVAKVIALAMKIKELEKETDSQFKRIVEMKVRAEKAESEADYLRDAIHSLDDPGDARGERTFHTERIRAVRRKMIENRHCQKCGYTQKDQAIHGDHHLCDGEIPDAEQA